MLLAVFSMLFLIDYPLEPSQVSLISVFTIGIPSFFLALEQNRNQIHGHFLTNVLIQALPAGITDFIVVSGLVIFCREFGVEKRVRFHVVHDPDRSCRLHDPLSYSKTDDNTACDPDRSDGHRLVILYAVFQ